MGSSTTELITSQRFLVVAPQGLGDSLEATPFVSALRNARPSARIDVVVTRAQARQLFEDLRPLVSDVIYLPFWESGKAAFIKALATKRWRAGYSAAFLMYPAARAEYQLMMRAFPARRRFSHRYYDPAPGNFLWLSSNLVTVGPKHNVLRNLDLLRAAGIEHTAGDRYVVPSSWIAPLNEVSRKRIAIHVGTIAHDGLDSRRWSLKNFITLAQALVARHFEVMAIIGPAERAETQQLLREVPQAVAFEGTLPQLARFLSTAGAVLTNDSGIGHLAAGVGAPVVSVFGPTPLEHAPYGPSSHPLRLSQCAPCFDPRRLNTQCALGIDFACLKQDTPVSAVLDAVLAAASTADLQREAECSSR